MTTSTSRIKGLEKLNRKLAALPRVTKDEVRKAIANSAREIADLAEVLVPQDSGDLAGSIGWTFGDAPGEQSILAQGMAAEVVATIYAGDDQAYYARWIEFGAEGVTAQPFFFVAYRALRKRTKSRIRRAGTKAAKKVAAT